MSNLTIEQKRDICRKLAEAMGWKCISKIYPSGVGYSLLKPDGLPHGASLCFNSPDAPWQFGPKYFDSEDDSARLLDAIADGNSYVSVEWDINEWCIDWKPTADDVDNYSVQLNNRDRKTVIVLAACKWKGIEGRNDTRRIL